MDPKSGWRMVAYNEFAAKVSVVVQKHASKDTTRVDVNGSAKPLGFVGRAVQRVHEHTVFCLLYTSPSPRDQRGSRMPSSA